MSVGLYLALLGGQFVYHRLTDKRKPIVGDRVIQTPVTEEGTAIPLYFGRVRIRAPIFAGRGLAEWYPSLDGFGWTFNVSGLDTDTYKIVYGLDMLFVLGIPFTDGINRMHGMWAGDTKMVSGILFGKTIEDATGDGNHEPPSGFTGPPDTTDSLACGEGLVEFLNGNSTQQLVNTTGTATLTYTADRLTTLGQGPHAPKKLGSLRGYTSVFLFSGRTFGHVSSTAANYADNFVAGAPLAQKYLRWSIGVTTTPPRYSFEASSYPNQSLAAQTVGLEANPADVAYAILKDKLGKLGLDATRVDYESFRAFAELLQNENHGYSRVFEGKLTAEQALQEIEQQTDCAFDEDPFDGKIKVKAIRADFNPATIPLIDPDNCSKIENLAVGGWTGVVNKIRVEFENREKGYQPDSVTAFNQANAVGQDGETRELVLNYPGVKTRALAATVCARELAARSRPIAKLRATVDRSFWDSMKGDPIAVTWPEYNISGRVFRVADVSRGTADSNHMILDLVEDFFYTHRYETTDTGGLPTHPAELAV